jgi:hypothetical protein
MSEALLTQRTLSRVIGAARLLRFIRAGRLAPAQRTSSRVLYRVSDVHAALRRLERHETLPPDKAEVLRVRLSETRNGHPRLRKVRPQPPGLEAIELDFSALNL